MSNDTLFGQRVLNLKFEDGRDVDMTIAQFKVRQYQAAFPLLDDEIALVAFAANAKRGVVEMLHPDSFEEAYAALKEVNAKGFFIWSERQLQRGAANMKNLPPELLEKVLARTKLTSMPSSPFSPPTAA